MNTNTENPISRNPQNQSIIASRPRQPRYPNPLGRK
jgi:hypothetical protein